MDWPIISGEISSNRLLTALSGLFSMVVATYGFLKWKATRSENKALKEAQEEAERAHQENKRLERELERVQLAALNTMHEVYEMLENCTDPNDGIAQRALILVGHNGGNMPDPSSPYYVSVIKSFLDGKVEKKPRDKPEERYSLVEVDRAYIRMLLDIYEHGHVELITDQMQDCVLRDWYKVEGVKHSIVMMVRTYGVNFSFISMAMYDRLFEPEEITEVRRVGNMIRSEIIKLQDHRADIGSDFSNR